MLFKSKSGGAAAKVVMSIFLLAAAFCGFMVINEAMIYREGTASYDDIAEAVTTVTLNEAGEDAEEGAPADIGDAPAAPQEGEEQNEPERETLTVDFDELISRNDDVIGWLYQEGTNINYPVMYGTNNSYYLNHLLDGTRNKMGSLFVDYLIKEPFFAYNTIIYGHNMKSGDMFASLTKYESQDYFDSHREFKLLTPERDYVLEIFAAFEVTASRSYFKVNIKNSAEFEKYLALLREHSVIQSDIEVGPEDRIVSLATCAYNVADGRFLVIGKLRAAEPAESVH